MGGQRVRPGCSGSAARGGTGGGPPRPTTLPPDRHRGVRPGHALRRSGTHVRDPGRRPHAPGRVHRGVHDVVAVHRERGLRCGAQGVGDRDVERHWGGSCCIRARRVRCHHRCGRLAGVLRSRSSPSGGRGVAQHDAAGRDIRRSPAGGLGRRCAGHRGDHCGCVRPAGAGERRVAVRGRDRPCARRSGHRLGVRDAAAQHCQPADRPDPPSLSRVPPTRRGRQPRQLGLRRDERDGDLLAAVGARPLGPPDRGRVPRLLAAVRRPRRRSPDEWWGAEGPGCRWWSGWP